MQVLQMSRSKDPAHSTGYTAVIFAWFTAPACKDVNSARETLNRVYSRAAVVLTRYSFIQACPRQIPKQNQVLI